MPRTSPASATRPRILGVGRTGHRGPLEAIEGTVRRVVFANEQSGWSVLKLSVAGRGEDVAAVGSFGGARPGESLRLTGRWEVDPAYGRQFRAESCLIVTPSTIAGIEKYLGSGLIPGIGPVMAARLVGRFGLEALEVIETDPGRLSEVDGIGPVRSERIRRAWREQKAIKQVMVFLHEHAVSPGQAVRIYRQYGDRSAAVIRDDPYRLAADIAHASERGCPPCSGGVRR